MTESRNLHQEAKHPNSELQRKSAVNIQRLWRGYNIRKEVALTQPRILTYATKLKLWNTPQQPRQEIENKLFAVHATDYFPINGVIRVIDPKIRGGSYFRPTTHFSLGELIRPQCDGKISRENKKFAVVTPLKDLTPQLLSLNIYDTYILGNFKLTNNSRVLVPAEEAKQFKRSYPNVNIVSYDPRKGLRLAVKDLIHECGGYDVTSFENDEKRGPWAPATSHFFESCNLNTPEFFVPILRQHRNVAFGAHYCSLFGSAYQIGIVDNALTQLGFSTDYFGYVYNEDPAFAKILVEHIIKKLENSLKICPSHAGSDVLKLHIKRAREGLQKLAASSERRSFAGDYAKARIARVFTWHDLLLFMQLDKRLALHIHNKDAFLCMYVFYRTFLLGERAATQEGLFSVFSHSFNRLEENMRIQVMGTILAIRSNMEDKSVFPGGLSYLRELLMQFGKSVGIAFNHLDTLEKITGMLLQILQVQQRFWLPTQIDLPDNNGNVPLIQALIAQDEKKALNLLNAGANIINVYGRIAGCSIPLLTIALRHSMLTFSEALLKRPDYTAWDEPDCWQNTPLCDAIAMGFGDIAAHLIERGARVNQRPNYAGIAEKDLTSLADRMGLVSVAAQLRERDCVAQPEIETQRVCLVM